MDLSQVNGRIEDRFAALAPQLKKAARFVLDRPEEVALSSMRAIAAKAEVKPSTMIRLARELDFPGYEEFRAPFRAWLRQRQVSFSERARQLQERARHSAVAALVNSMMTADVANLQESYTSLGDARLTEAVGILAQAPRIFVIGLRSLYPAAFAFHYACRMFMDGTILLTGQGGTFADELRRVTPGDVVLAIGDAPYPRDIIRAVDFSIHLGARVVAITDSPVSPLARRATLVLQVKTGGPSFFASIVPALSIVQTLVAMLLAQSGEEALARMSRSERQLHSFEVFVEDEPAAAARQRQRG